VVLLLVELLVETLVETEDSSEELYVTQCAHGNVTTPNVRRNVSQSVMLPNVKTHVSLYKHQSVISTVMNQSARLSAQTNSVKWLNVPNVKQYVNQQYVLLHAQLL